MPEPERSTGTCKGHVHMAMQVVHYTDQIGGLIYVSKSVEEAQELAETIAEDPTAIAIFGTEMEVYTN